MQTLQAVCPNCVVEYLRIMVIYLNKKLWKKQKSYEGMNQFQQEQFSISFDNLQQQKQTHYLSEHKNQFQGPPQNVSKQIVPTQPEIDQQLGTDAESAIIPQEFQQTVPQFQKLNFKDFQINLGPYDQYYQLLSSKTQDIEKLFSNKLYTKVDLSKYNKLNRSNLQIRQYPATSGFKFVLRYELPCSYSFYRKLNQQTNQIEKIYDKIGSYDLLESVQPNLQVFNLELKKIMGLGMEPRKFTYIKYMNTSNDVHWETCISVDLQTMEKYNPMKKDSIKSADLFSITHLHQRRFDSQAQVQTTLLVQTYLQVNLHSIVKAEKLVNKALLQVKTYINNIYEYADEKFDQQNDYV